jgi:hypothetical protein
MAMKAIVDRRTGAQVSPHSEAVIHLYEGPVHPSLQYVPESFTVRFTSFRSATQSVKVQCGTSLLCIKFVRDFVAEGRSANSMPGAISDLLQVYFTGIWGVSSNTEILTFTVVKDNYSGANSISYSKLGKTSWQYQ